MIKVIKRTAFSLVIGALFGGAMATKLEAAPALASGAAAAAFMYGGFIYNGRVERREAVARRQDDA